MAMKTRVLKIIMAVLRLLLMIVLKLEYEQAFSTLCTEKTQMLTMNLAI